MRKLIMALIGVALLSGCAAIQGGIAKMGEATCANADGLRQAYTTALVNAAAILDPVARQTAVGTLQAQLDALALCPPRTAPESILPPVSAATSAPDG